MTKLFVIGSVQWLKALREGAFDNRPPVPSAPQRAARRWTPGAVVNRDMQAPPKPHPNVPASGNGNPCPYCRMTMMIGTLRAPTRDHMIPRWRGGRHGTNVILVCRPCNQDKGGLTLDEWARQLIEANDPRAPIVAAKLKRRMRGDRRFRTEMLALRAHEQSMKEGT